jgi:hypothetical protein
MPVNLSYWGLLDDKLVTGVCLVKEGGGAGTWARVDEYGQPMTLPGNYFFSHPTYTGMERVTVSNQEMVKIPAFFVKNLIPNYGPYGGRPCWIISPTPRDGFRLHPAFKNTEGDLSSIYIGAYLATNNGGNVYGSLPGKPPAVSVNITNFKARINALNTGNVSGFHMMRFYEWAALQCCF